MVTVTTAPNLDLRCSGLRRLPLHDVDGDRHRGHDGSGGPEEGRGQDVPEGLPDRLGERAERCERVHVDRVPRLSRVLLGLGCNLVDTSDSGKACGGSDRDEDAPDDQERVADLPEDGPPRPAAAAGGGLGRGRDGNRRGAGGHDVLQSCVGRSGYFGISIYLHCQLQVQLEKHE